MRHVCRPSFVPTGALVALLLVGCSAPTPAPAAAPAAAKAKAAAGTLALGGAYKLYANTRLDMALAIAAGVDGGAPAIVYASEAQVISAMETANAAVVQAAQAGARAAEALQKAQAAGTQLTDAIAKAQAAGDAAAVARAQAALAANQADAARAQADLAAASAQTVTGQVALAATRAEAAATQAALGLAKAQQALDAATTSGDAARTAQAAATMADARARSAESALALTDAKAAAAAQAASAAAGQAASAAQVAGGASQAANAAQTQALSASQAAASAQATATGAAQAAQAANLAAQAALAAAQATPTPGPAATVITFLGADAGAGDGGAGAARLNDPSGLDIDAAGNLYVADAGNHRVRKLAPDGTGSTLAGGVAGSADGAAGLGRFDAPLGVAYRHDGTLLVADGRGRRVRAIAPDGAVTILAGDGEAGDRDGSGAEARFQAPTGLALDATGAVYVADSQNLAVRKIYSDGRVVTLARAPRPASGEPVFVPTDVVAMPDGRIVVSDSSHHVLFEVDQAP